MDNGHWEYPINIDVNEWFGFIYRIIELHTGREYIGKKQFWSITRKKVSGRKNRKVITKESDWKTYTGSSKSLNDSIENNGKENYAFFIESLHETKGSLFYAEVEKQIKENVLREMLDDGITPKYYNRQISGVKFIPSNPTTKEEYTNINNYTINEHQLNRISGLCGSDNPQYGKKSVLNGITYEEYYGVEKSEEIKQKLREFNTGKESPMRGVDFHTDEQKEKWSQDERRRHYGEDNGMYGKPCYYKMTEEEKQRWKDNLSASGKGRVVSEDTKKKMSKSGKGKQKPTVECPYCKKVGSTSNMYRYHFDYCKENPNALPRKIPEKKKCPHCGGHFDLGNYAKFHGDNCKSINGV